MSEDAPSQVEGRKLLNLYANKQWKTTGDELLAKSPIELLCAAVRFKHVVASCKGKKGQKGREWVTAPSLAHALEALEALKAQSFSMKQVKLVVGNTSSGIYKDMNPQVYVDISKVRDSKTVTDS